MDAHDAVIAAAIHIGDDGYTIDQPTLVSVRPSTATERFYNDDVAFLVTIRYNAVEGWDSLIGVDDQGRCQILDGLGEIRYG